MRKKRKGLFLIKFGAELNVTSETFSHEDLVSQGVTQNHTNKFPVPCPLHILAAFTAAVGGVILESKGDPDWFTTFREGERG